MTKLVPTDEQVSVIDLALTGEPLKIEAYAGAAKTSTMEMVVHADKRCGDYIAFNRANVEEAKTKMPKAKVVCKTSHQHAHASQKPVFGTERLNRAAPGWMLAKTLGLRQYISIPEFEVSLSPKAQGSLLKATISRFCASADDTFAPHHVPRPNVLQGMSITDFRAGIAVGLAEMAQKLWNEHIIHPRSQMLMGHDVYLKLWALSRPQFSGEYVILDEAQDTNPVVIKVIAEQKRQIICVGDTFQQIYEWRGAQNAIEQIPAKNTANLSTSFRYGQTIADRAMGIIKLLGATRPLIGARTDTSEGKTNAVLARTNGRLMAELVDLLQQGHKPYIAGGDAFKSEMLTYIGAAEKLQSGQEVEYPLDFVGYKNWHEVREAIEKGEADELKKWDTLFGKYSPSDLRSMLECCVQDPKRATITLSTGHKSKGLQWDNVSLLDDFLLGVSDDPSKPIITLPDAELRLLYVAMTRPKYNLKVDPVVEGKLRRIKAAVNGFQE